MRLCPAQDLTNGSFETGDFTGWQVAGIPVVMGSPPAPPDGNYQALVNSTGSSATGIYSSTNAVSADALNTFLNTTLPSNANGDPINGEAIQQTFTVTAASTITFSYSYQSREAPGNGYDETGYVLNGVFHILADTNTPGQDMAYATGLFVWGLPYQTATISVGPGTYTLAFVAYNTFNEDAPSGLFIDDLVIAPAGQTFGEWKASYSFSGTPAGTPENDGVPNLFKYLYDINPTAPMSPSDRAALPVLGTTTVAGTDYLTLTYRQNSSETGVTVNLQTSPDMINWTTVSPALSQKIDTDPETGDPIIQLGAPATGGHQFLRLQLTKP